jgi:carbamoylphosphate synthase large subunit
VTRIRGSAGGRRLLGHGVLAGRTVAVLWTGRRAGPWACRSLRDAGARVVGIHPARLPGARSTACLRPLRSPPVRAHEDLLAFVAEVCAREGVDVVVPVDEDLVRLMAHRRPDLGGAVVAGPDGRQYDALCDKLALARAAAACGVDHPRTVLVTAAGPDGPWPSLPSVVKPRISMSSMGDFPISSVETAQERDAAVARLRAAGGDALVQERIVDGRRWVAHCVRGATGTACVVSRILHDHPRDTGVASVQHTVPGPPAVVEGAARLLAHVDYRGPATLSFLESQGRYLVHDVNLRLGASTGLLVRSGFDMPARAAQVTLGDERGAAVPDWRPMSYVRTDGEVVALRDALLRAPGHEPAALLARRLAFGALGPRAMLDPSPLDILWLGGLAAQTLRETARRARAAVRPQGGHSGP